MKWIQSNDDYMQAFQSFSIFSKYCDFSKLQISNWYLENPETEFDIMSPTILTSKDPNYAQKNPDDISLLKVFKVEDKQGESEDSSTTEDCRSDIQMKSVLRRIHRDLKREFRTFTSFNLNRLYREKRYFISCLDEYSKVIFGVNPTQREIVLLGALIANKWILKYLQMQIEEGEIDEEQYSDFEVLDRQVYLALYKFSQASLNKLAQLKELRSIITHHKETLLDSCKMSKNQMHFYNQVIEKFGISSKNLV